MKMKKVHCLRHRRLFLTFLLLLLTVLTTVVLSSLFSRRHVYMPELEFRVLNPNHTTTSFPKFTNTKMNSSNSQQILQTKTSNSDFNSKSTLVSSPYHDWELFESDFSEMLQNLKIYVYPDVFSTTNNASNPNIFLPYQNAFDPKLGNYHSEHMFKIALLQSSFITPNPKQAHFFFLPFSINALRNDPNVRSESSIPQFVAQYTRNISNEFGFWNASGGSDHFFVCCHSVGREAVSLHWELHNNAIQVTCSSSYFQRLYVTRKDLCLPQVWPRADEQALNPPDKRDKLVFFSGRIQNSVIRQELISLFGNDTSLDIFSKRPSYPYDDGFRKSKYCLHVKGYEVNTARVSDAIHYGCIPVIISNYYDLPFANILDWTKFSVIINHGDIYRLKEILLSIPSDLYVNMFGNLCLVRKHFVWHMKPEGYDSFHMTAYQLWLRRNVNRVPSNASC